MIHGLDISAAQGPNVNWDLVPAKFEFIIQQSTNGEHGADPTRFRNFAEAHRTGRSCSWYHFCSPTQDPKAQAQHLWDATGKVMPDFRPALDFESAAATLTPTELLDWFVRIADAVEESFGLPPMVYTYPWFYKSRVAPGLTPEYSSALARCPLWMADYSHGESPPEGSKPFLPAPWTDWTMWQTSGDHSTHEPGFGGAVDHDVFNGDADAWRVFRGL